MDGNPIFCCPRLDFGRGIAIIGHQQALSLILLEIHVQGVNMASIFEIVKLMSYLTISNYALSNTFFANFCANLHSK